MSASEVAHQQLLIGGDWTDAAFGATYETANPWTGETASVAPAVGRAGSNDSGPRSQN